MNELIESFLKHSPSNLPISMHNHQMQYIPLIDCINYALRKKEYQECKTGYEYLLWFLKWVKHLNARVDGRDFDVRDVKIYKRHVKLLLRGRQYIKMNNKINALCLCGLKSKDYIVIIVDSFVMLEGILE